jgi:hypothetical protein
MPGVTDLSLHAPRVSRSVQGLIILDFGPPAASDRTLGYSEGLNGMPTTSSEVCGRELRHEIDRRFPRGHAVAVEGGVIIADAPSFRELAQKLTAMGKTSKDILVLEAGVDPSEMNWILAAHQPCE